MEQEKQSVYQAKIDEMQKYVPFLENIIAQLKQESQDAKVAQMELLYKAITNLQPTKISLDDFKKCQEALEDIYKLSNGATDKQKTTQKEPVEIEKTNPTVCQFETAANSQPKSTKAAQEAENVDGATADCPKANVKFFETCINSESRKPVDGDATECDPVSEETNTDKAEKFKENNIAEKPSNVVGKEAAGLTNSKTDNLALPELGKNNNPPLENKHQHTDQDLAPVPNNQVEQQEPNNEVCNDNEKMLAESDTDDDAEEENVELINVPEDGDGDEMILPDSVDGAYPANESSEDEETIDKESMLHDDSNGNSEDEADATESKESTTFGSHIEHQNKCETAKCAEQTAKENLELEMNAEEAAEEPNLVGPERECHKDLENSSADYDPLQVREMPDEQAAEKENQVPEVVPDHSDNNDDDEVQFIETRNSPICLDSDDDDVDDAANRMEAASPLLIPLEACTSAPTLAQNSDGNTIELLDSSDEDLPTKQRDRKRRNSNVTLSSKPALMMHKRTLLPLQKKYTEADSSQAVVAESGQGSCALLAAPGVDSTDEDLPTKQRGRKKKNVKVTLTSKPTKLLQKRTLLPQQKKCREASSSQAAGGNCDVRPQPCGAETLEKTLAVANFTPTPQSNFLNAFNLQPTKPGENPPVFSAKLLNKDVIIPNAFYGNRPETRTVETSEPGVPKSASRLVTGITTQHLDRAYRQWLENFIKCFTNPQHIVSHTCFVLLQQTLKYKLFTRIKDMRTTLNTKAYNSTEQTNVQLRHELRNAFYNGDKQLSEVGRRFCSMACSGINSHAVTLTSDVHTGWATSHTWTLQEMNHRSSADKESATTASASTADTAASTSGGRKRYTEDAEYTPGKLVLPAIGGESNGERRKSLRTQRTQRCDKRFSYNEDEADDDESEENYSYAVVRRKVEQKRLEAQQQRQQQVKSFENAFLEMFGKNGNRKATTSCRVMHPTNRPKPAEISSQLETRKPASNASETQITLDDDGNILQLDDEPKEHRIYKVIPTQLLVAPSEESTATSAHETNADSAELIICDDLDSNSNDVVATNSSVVDVLPAAAPKNTNINTHSLSRDHEWCILCQRRVTRIVHHYVNEHRGCEVYTARLPNSKVRRLRRNQGNTASISLYKNGQLQYEARCIFCLKPCRFMMPYWYQHFSMHTGEYAYRCSGCGLRKPTRSLLMAHTNQPCPQGGKLLRDYHYDSKTTEIAARICTLCNYVQLHRHSIVQHLHTQHNIQQILPKHIERVVLLQTPQQKQQQRATRLQRTTTCGVVQVDDSSDSNASAAADHPYITSDYNDLCASQAGLWDQASPADDLSFMICDMLDVQMDMD